jgi:hypothetical protein
VLATNQYIVISDVVYQLYLSDSGRLVFNICKSKVTYEPSLDGKAYSREEIERRYPEWCI